MKLLEKTNLIWKNGLLGKFSKKSILASFTAMGLLGGFFVLQAMAEAGISSVTFPEEGALIGGNQTITWVADCENTDWPITGIRLLYIDSAGSHPITIINECTQSYSWDTSTVIDGDYKIKVMASNDADLYAYSGEFTIDNTAPVISAGTISTPGSLLNGQTAYNITWTSGNITDANLEESPIGLYYSVDKGDWQLIASGITNSGTYASWTPSGINSSDVKIKITATDKAGNIAEQESAAFTVDSTAPTATVAVNSTETLNDHHLTKIVTVAYNETMDKTIIPTITFSAGTTWTGSEGAWDTNGTIWTETFTLTDNGEEINGVYATASGAKDLAGNTQESATSNSGNYFDIDTLNPTATTATATPNPAKAGSVDITVEFSEEMRTDQPATVVVTGITGDPISVTGSFNSSDLTEWKGSFTLADNNEEKTATIAVSDAMDATGNGMTGNTAAGTFEIDTITPLVNSITFGTAKIYDRDLEQEVTVTFSEEMSKDSLDEPYITFSNTGYGSDGDGQWNSDKTVWTETFTFTDEGEEATDITATVTNAADLAGNKIASSTSLETFDIDTKNPTVVLSDDQYGNTLIKKDDEVKITATFSEAVTAPKITIGGLINGDAMTVTAETGDTIWTYSWVVPTGNDGDVNVSISAIDNFGNVNTSATGTTSYTIDNTAPTVGLTYNLNRNVKDADILAITATFSEAVSIPTIIINTSDVDLSEISMSPTSDSRIWNYNYNVPAGSNGLAIVTVSGKDIVGNESVETSNNTFTIDNVIPAIGTISSPTANSVYKINVPLTFTAASNDANEITCSYQIDGVGDDIAIGCTGGTLSGLADGRHTITVTAIDGAENEASETSSSFVVDIDNTLTVGVSGEDFTTIQNAINKASESDTILVSAGVYNENIDINKTGLKVVAVENAAPEITATSGNVATMSAAGTIDGFKITGGDYGIYSENIFDVVIQNNDIRSYNKNGIFANGGTISILDNVITGNGKSETFSKDAIYTRGGVSATITGNELRGNVYTDIAGGTAAGISIHAGDNITATDNMIYDNSIGIHAKSGSTVNAKGKNNISDNSFNFYFEDNNPSLTTDIDISKNWWGSNVKTTIEGGIFGGVDFDPWYMDEEMTILSDSDKTGPEVVLSSDDSDGIVKSGDTVTITAKIIDPEVSGEYTSGVDTDIAPIITITNGQIDSGSGTTLTATMTYASGDNWTYSWTVPTGNATATISVEAQDIVGNPVSSISEVNSYTIDNAAPLFTITDRVATEPVQSDTINITIRESVTESKYGFSANNTCDADDSYDTAFVSGTDFAIAGDHTDYLCVMAEDVAGNIGYGYIGQLNTDNIAPSAPTIAMTDPVMNSNVATVAITGTGEANAAISWTIKDSKTGEISKTGTVDTAGNISITNINVTSLADGDLIASVTLTDKAGNEGIARTDNATKDVLAPTITRVTSSVANGTYGVDKVIDIDLTFSEAVTGTFNVTLNASSSAICSFKLETAATSGSCNYTVVAEDNTSKLETTISGTDVIDKVGNAMTVFTPAFDKKIAIDTTAPSGYSVSIDQNYINSDNQTAMSFAFADAEVGATYNYAISDGDSTTKDVTESGTIATATDKISSINISGLADETLTLSVILTDGVGNVGIAATDTITKDTVAPTITVPTNMTVEATGPAGKVVSYTTSTDDGSAVICTPDSGKAFPLGKTTVTCTATDSYSNTGKNSFTITVVDKTAPIISKKENVIAEATSPEGAVVEYKNPTATDLVDTDVDVSCTPISGSSFPLGTTTVTCTATDDYDNSSTSTFTITVVDTVDPEISGIVPVENSTTSDVTPEISAVFSDSGIGINPSTATIAVDGTSQTAWADIDVNGITYTSDPLTDGQHTVTIYVEDYAGNSASASWTFKVLASAKSITVSSSKSELDADGTSSATITASLTEDGTALAGATVNFSSTIGDFSQNSTTTNSSGKAIVTLTSTTAGVDPVTVSYGSGSNLVQASVSVIFNEIEIDDEAPTATSNPADGETGVAVDSDIVITFSEEMDDILSSDIELRAYDTTTKVSASLDTEVINGKTIVTINPDSTLAYNTHYYIYISEAEDLAENAFDSWTKSDEVNHEFTTKNAATTTIGINLQVGWNLVSLPIIPEDSSIEAVLEETTLSHIEIIQYYDTRNEQWLTYKPGVAGGGLTDMEAGKGYWIDMNTNDGLTVKGYELPSGGSLLPTYEVFGEKWNLIGFKSVEEMTAKEYISQMGSDDILYVYKNGKYESLDGDDMMEVGYGYWFYTYDADGFNIVPKK